MKKSKGLFMMLALTLLIVSCGQRTVKDSDGSSMESDLTQIVSGSIYGCWQLEKYNPVEYSSMFLAKVKSDKSCQLQFLDTGTFSCKTDCNSISGDFAVDDSLLSFQNMAWTEMACDDMTIEIDMKIILPRIKKYTVTPGFLFLQNGDGRTLAVFSKIGN
ncbi:MULTISPECIES: META domain-containing protein [Bacteroidales]|jgi:heat shock protein HslJ|uniref:META domain-containing protein n=2 Tax=Bacteroidales TaxID=171549 RepID=A0AC61QUL7_9BACT|nr:MULTISPECIES: META domain-containing protein [Bacteroidales]ROT06344.1 META domain-containing protein [Muribaculaceae bacterium Isolate-037 (Harlan)]ROT17372.1 META domain-containing protein [Muribaculaceae bacterium Isolate-114 (HZI)]ROT18668.1 META domain-containing protein [Muribaculaceae bacterium Isolate-113 (HZI)]THG53487.1 META domain-containing protein [Bacteroidales bacterium]GFI13103.1 hypothetical protein IMSAGC008_00631 [Muribaculaceae bacterium]